MNLKTWKASLVTFGLAGTFMLGAGLANSANVAAQDWRGSQNRDRRDLSQQELQQREEQLRRMGWDGRFDRNGNVDLNRNKIDDRYEDDLFRNDHNDRNGYGSHENDRNYRERRSDNYGYNNEVRRGYWDGIEQGRNASRLNRQVDLNYFSQYRNGGQAFREGFHRGFFEAYHQHNNRRW